MIRNPSLYWNDPEIPHSFKIKLNRYRKLGIRDSGRAKLAAKIRADWPSTGLDTVYLAAILAVLDYQAATSGNNPETDHPVSARQQLEAFWVSHGMEMNMLGQITGRQMLRTNLHKVSVCNH